MLGVAGSYLFAMGVDMSTYASWVGSGAEAVAEFCTKYEEIILARDIGTLSAVWCLGGTFEWLACPGGHFAKILAGQRRESSQAGHVVFVYDHAGHLDVEMTDEVNRMIFNKTGGRWLPPRKG